METLERWYASLHESAVTTGSLLGYTRDLAVTAVSKDKDSVAWTEYARTAAIALFCSFLCFVFVVAPARAGFWTGRKARRHRIHRYMGISYLLHYALAWVEFFTNYEASRTSYLVHIIAVNGTYTVQMMRGCSTRVYHLQPHLNCPTKIHLRCRHYPRELRLLLIQSLAGVG